MSKNSNLYRRERFSKKSRQERHSQYLAQSVVNAMSGDFEGIIGCILDSVVGDDTLKTAGLMDNLVSGVTKKQKDQILSELVDLLYQASEHIVGITGIPLEDPGYLPSGDFNLKKELVDLLMQLQTVAAASALEKFKNAKPATTIVLDFDKAVALILVTLDARKRSKLDIQTVWAWRLTLLEDQQ